jgi:hypothetical protein
MQYGEIDPSRARSEGLEGDGTASGSMGGKKMKGRNGRRKQTQQSDEVETREGCRVQEIEGTE